MTRALRLIFVLLAVVWCGALGSRGRSASLLDAREPRAGVSIEQRTIEASESDVMVPPAYRWLTEFADRIAKPDHRPALDMLAAPAREALEVAWREGSTIDVEKATLGVSADFRPEVDYLGETSAGDAIVLKIRGRSQSPVELRLLEIDGRLRCVGAVSHAGSR